MTLPLASRDQGADPAPRICIVTETYFPVVGGGETQTRSLAEDLAAAGSSVTIITRRSSHSLKAFERRGLIKVLRIPPVGKARFARWALLVTTMFALLRNRGAYEVIYVSGFKALGLSAVLAGKLFRKAVVLKADSNGEMSGEFFAGGLKRLGLRPSSLPVRAFLSLRNSILRRADSFVAISSLIAAEFARCGVSPDRIHRIANSVDTGQYRPVSHPGNAELRRKLGLPQNGALVTYTGRLVTYKGLPLLLQVWRRIKRRYGNATLVLVGSGGLDMHNCEAQLKSLASSEGLRGSVHFAGDVHNVHEYLQASDIFVLPTEKEAFGIALIEAMACGLPVVASRTGGIKDIVTHRYDGLLVEPGDAEQLYRAICELLDDKSLAARLGRAALHTSRERYARDAIAAEYLELFIRLARSGGKGRLRAGVRHAS